MSDLKRNIEDFLNAGDIPRLGPEIDESRSARTDAARRRPSCDEFIAAFNTGIAEASRGACARVVRGEAECFLCWTAYSTGFAFYREKTEELLWRNGYENKNAP